MASARSFVDSSRLPPAAGADEEADADEDAAAEVLAAGAEAAADEAAGAEAAAELSVVLAAQPTRLTALSSMRTASARARYFFMFFPPFL